MEVLASTVSGAVVAAGQCLCGSMYDMIKDTVKFQSKLDNLDKEMKRLLAVKVDVEKEIEFAVKRDREPKNQVTVWLREVEELRRKVDQIQDRWSLNCCERCTISWEVAEKLKEIEDLQRAGSAYCGAVTVVHSTPRPVEYIPGPTIQDQTTSTNLTTTRSLLSDDNIRMIGILGMGGVSKTTLVRTLNNELKSTSNQAFDIVIWVTVSKNLDMKNVQAQIANRLNMEVKTEESMGQMAGRLFRRLQEEKFLLILDDVWEKIDLGNLGVPDPVQGSKIILTTRLKKVCTSMKNDKTVKVAVLNDKVSCQLFSENAGDVASLNHIRSSADAIVRQCCGLPLTLVTMGAFLRENEIVEWWELALKEMQHPMECPLYIVDNIYARLKSSYDLLEGRNKPCFLYCSLFPKGFSIKISELAQCWLAEGLPSEQGNYEASHLRVIDLIENLKESCLLEDGDCEGTVKMQDIIRDVAIWIAWLFEAECKSLVCSGMGSSDMSCVELSNSKRVSLMNSKIIKLPCMEQCSEVTTLLLLVLSISLEGIPCLSYEDPSWIDRLSQFHFSVGPMGKFLPTTHEKRAVVIRSLDLCSEEWIGPLSRNASSLNLGNCLGLSKMPEDLAIKSLRRFDGLKSLNIQSCSRSVWQGGCVTHDDPLPKLKELYLRDLNYRISISELLGHVGLRFLTLKLVEVEWCSEMKYLLSCGSLIHDLPKLEVIKVQNCRMLVELFSYHSIAAADPIVPSLRTLELKGLPELKTLCLIHDLPKLEVIKVQNCYKLVDNSQRNSCS